MIVMVQTETHGIMVPPTQREIDYKTSMTTHLDPLRGVGATRACSLTHYPLL